MELNTRNRGELKTFFKKNSIPTEANFGDLIEAGLNQRDDGIAKSPGDPLALEATGDPAGQQKVLHLYKGFDDDAPRWTLSLNPRTDAAKPETAQPGFNLADDKGVSRLFVQAATGRVGIGTLTPSAALTVGGDASVGSNGNRIDFNSKHTGSSNAVANVAEISNDTTGNKALMIVGNRSAGLNAPGLGRRVGIWDLLDVHGDLSVSGNVHFGTKVRQMLNLWSHRYGVGVQSSTMYFRTAKNFAWYKDGNHADGQLDRGGGTVQMVIRDGNVGIGTASPTAKLHVTGTSSLAQEGWHEISDAMLLNKWKRYHDKSYNSPAYFKDSQGIVHLKGLIAKGTIGHSVPIFKLPKGYRPAKRELHVNMSMSKAGRCDIGTDGSIYASLGNNGWYSLDGITFRAATSFQVLPIVIRR